MTNNLFYIKNAHKINNIKLKAFVLGFGKLKKSELAYDNCELTKLINQKLSNSPENSSVLLKLNYAHQQYHKDAENIIEINKSKPKEAMILLNKLKDNSHFIIEEISKF